MLPTRASETTGEGACAPRFFPSLIALPNPAYAAFLQNAWMGGRIFSRGCSPGWYAWLRGSHGLLWQHFPSASPIAQPLQPTSELSLRVFGSNALQRRGDLTGLV